ncbi:hypothetical protein BDW02DRAFT_412586 [Decorospora gaudefroyi]|uniref:Secreted protein n=1 Tax=Decorospora gaudefroyi TaxID=184978 RepID=A0A6A5KQM0_9PLEO|nr:hypothetical protein BDW02DRAFT_412586 [Decorospora gaudefroyi]
MVEGGSMEVLRRRQLMFSLLSAVALFLPPPHAAFGLPEQNARHKHAREHDLGRGQPHLTKKLTGRSLVARRTSRPAVANRIPRLAPFLLYLRSSPLPVVQLIINKSRFCISLVNVLYRKGTCLAIAPDHTTTFH